MIFGGRGTRGGCWPRWAGGGDGVVAAGLAGPCWVGVAGLVGPGGWLGGTRQGGGAGQAGGGWWAGMGLLVGTFVQPDRAYVCAE